MAYEMIHSGNMSEILRISRRVCLRIGNLPVRDQCNTGIVLSDEGIVLIDYPEQHPDEEIIEEAEILFKKPVSHIIFTHAHGDHRNGLASLHRRGIRLLGGENAIREIESCYPSLPLDRRAIHSGEGVEIGNVRFSFWLPLRLPAHSPWDTAVSLPDEDAVFTGDFLVPPDYLYFHSSDWRNWLWELQKFEEAVREKILLMGHGYPQTKDSGCRGTMQYIKLLTALSEVLYEKRVTVLPERHLAVPDSAKPLFDALCSTTDPAAVRRQLIELQVRRGKT